jgi:hypothetical protein
MRDTYYEERCAELEVQLASAVDRLREIAAMKTVSKRQRVNSELAINWLTSHGYALEEGRYRAGVGFKEDNILLRRQAE